MTIKQSILSALFAGIMGFSAQASVLDANHATTDDPNNGTGLGIVTTALGQTFTAIGNGILETVSFRILKINTTPLATEDVTFDIRNVDGFGAPDANAGDALFTTSIANGDIGVYGPQPYDWSLITVDVSSANIEVSMGDQLAFILSASLGQEFGVQTDYLDAYSGGARFSQNGDGTAFSSLSTADLTFSTTLAAPIPVPASLPLLLAGFGAIGIIARRKAKTS